MHAALGANGWMGCRDRAGVNKRHGELPQRQARPQMVSSAQPIRFPVNASRDDGRES